MSAKKTFLKVRNKRATIITGTENNTLGHDVVSSGFLSPLGNILRLNNNESKKPIMSIKIHIHKRWRQVKHNT